ncbi:MAG: SNF2 helicase associated domain-containing protein, partial [Lentisphaeraceae bacterium]|nr:SNF2 helicase associated domain-containing protein [Lentisphaeraceae bacterium]
MGLISRYKAAFGKTLQHEGEELFNAQAVSIFEGGDEHLVCEIRTSDTCFEVELQVKNAQTHILCECNNLADKPCAHIWAAIVAAENYNVFKDGHKRGVRLAGTAAARASKSTSVATLESIKSTASSTSKTFPIPGTPSHFKQQAANYNTVVTREVLFIVNGSGGTPFEEMAFEFFWRPVGEKGPLKALKTESPYQGLSSEDSRIMELLWYLRKSTGAFLKTSTRGLASVLQGLIKRNRLFARQHSGQKKFTKIAHWGEAEQVQLLGEQLGDGNYLCRLQLENETLDQAIFICNDFILGQRQLFCGDGNFSHYQKLLNYLYEHRGVVSAWEAEGFLESCVLPTKISTENLPGRLRCEHEQVEVKGHLFVRTALFKFRDKEQLHAELSFNYGEKHISEIEKSEQVLDYYNSRIFTRDKKREETMRQELRECGFRHNEESHKEEAGWKLLPSRLPEIVEKLLRQGWSVIADGKNHVAPKSFELRLSSGADWFDLQGEAVYGEEVLPLAELAKASEGGNKFVELGDGSFGILPEDWLKHYTVLTQLGEICGDDIRFRKSQGLLIEKLLQDRGLDNDAGFQALKASLRKADHLTPTQEPAGFQGQLRPYQRMGLSWLKFLERTGFGGVLADDMGLGKTVQILALLQSRIHLQKAPTLLLVPKSLIFNWQSEAKKFAPELRVVAYTGPGRRSIQTSFKQYHLIVTTYGTMRQDIDLLVNQTFDYFILDEAQVIKNRDSSTAKAARLIKANHRLCMSGTPVENSLSDLLSLLELLNPGMTAGGKLAEVLEVEKLTKENLSKLRDAFRPFILRRTKEEVAKDLPPKSEQVIYCDMDDKQKELYDKMLAWYRQELKKQEDKAPAAGQSQGINYLGALTKLRQMCCHPFLASEEWREIESVKIKVLMAKLEEIISEGHRALIFSQFTSFLDLIRQQVEMKKWNYNYLDGSTKDRQGEVDKFQNNIDTPLFLISLKAGGVGLNL